MKYETGAAFRRALEDRLRAKSLSDGMPLMRLRKMVAFERLLARLVHDQPEAWLLKGGLALQWRLGSRARTTQDVDVLLVDNRQEDLHSRLARAALVDLGDWFRYLVQRPRRQVTPDAGGARYSVQTQLGGRSFEMFHIDVGWGDPVIESPEAIVAPSLLDFADLEPVTMLCYPVTQHLAEKFHAYTMPRTGRENSRVKDLVDIVLIAEMRLSAHTLLAALKATFQERGTHELPVTVPRPPSSWVSSYRRMAMEVDLAADRIDVGLEIVNCLLDPILKGRDSGHWNPERRCWVDELSQ
jgi:hypothetical protein